METPYQYEVLQNRNLIIVISHHINIFTTIEFVFGELLFLAVVAQTESDNGLFNTLIPNFL